MTEPTTDEILRKIDELNTKISRIRSSSYAWPYGWQMFTAGFLAALFLTLIIKASL